MEAYLKDPFLGKYSPLDRVLLAHDFDNGMQGWQTYFPDYDGWEDYQGRYQPVEPLTEKLEQARDPATRWDRRAPVGPRSVPMISSLTSWDIGTNGSWGGNYALKIPSIARAGARAVGMKRMACPWRGKFRIETYFTYQADPSDFKWGEDAIRSIGVHFDAFDQAHIKEQGLKPIRYHPSILYKNFENGKPVRHWHIYNEHSSHVGPTHTPLEDGHQELGFNRAVTKYQWHYLRLTFDIATHEYVDFHCYGKEFNVAGMKIKTWDPEDPELTERGWEWRASMDRTSGLIFPDFNIIPDQDKRCFLYLDSVVVSATEK
jgi:hypothetical protein